MYEGCTGRDAEKGVMWEGCTGRDAVKGVIWDYGRGDV